jgi:hypothetical protein
VVEKDSVGGSWEGIMPAVSWFYATLAVMLLCALAIVLPFVVAQGAGGWN